MTPPDFLQSLKKSGLRPFVATTGSSMESLDLSVLGDDLLVYLLEEEADRPFHDTYLTANALGFGQADLKMPNWVLVDCVLMQTAIVGLAISQELAPPTLIEAFREDQTLDLDKVPYLPVSGQIAGLGLDGQTLVGFSLFSLRRFLTAVPALGLKTKALALKTYRGMGKRFLGISHYDNKALSMHGRFGKKMWIEQSAIPLHPRRDMALVYGMMVDFNLNDIQSPRTDEPYDFLMRADDSNTKQEIAQKIRSGERAIIAPPFQIQKDDSVFLPIRMEKNS